MITYEAVVFDKDGVLVEITARDRLATAIRNTFLEFDVDPPAEYVREMAVRDIVADEHLREEFGIDPEAFWRRREANASAIQREEIRAGEKTLYDDVAAIQDLACPKAVVSNNQHETVEFVLEYYELLDHFETYYGREPTLAGAARKKPDPSYIEQALEDLGTTDALYVGDSEKDVVAARRAGVDSAFLRRDHRADLTLSAEPTYEFADLTALVDAIGPRTSG